MVGFFPLHAAVGWIFYFILGRLEKDYETLLVWLAYCIGYPSVSMSRLVDPFVGHMVGGCLPWCDMLLYLGW